MFLRLPVLLACLLVVLAYPLRAIAPLDTLVFGNSASESSHALVATQTEVITGALSQTARRCLPFTTPTVDGGDLTFTMAVDPVRRNYVTIKLWGGDDTDDTLGRLYLYVPQGGVDYQVGYRHEGDYMPLSVAASTPPLPGRFFYSTTLLPLSMTAGKTSLTLKLQSTGRLYGLGSGGPPSGNYQFNMTVPGRGIYRAYTHVEPMLEPSGETQGAAPTTTTRPAVTENSVIGPSGTYTNGLNSWVAGRLTAATTSFNTISVQFLAEAYQTPRITNAYGVPAVVDKVVAVIDAFATHYYANPDTAPSSTSSYYGAAPGNEVWGGRFGPLGWAVHLLQTPLAARLDETADYGVGGVRSRRSAWGDLLFASREFGRFTRDNRAITNQGLLADQNIYKANRGLLALGDVRAFSDVAAQRYLKEACGLLPWTGSDLATGGSSLKYGSGYYQVTPKGMTREWGYVGSYGEMAGLVSSFAGMTGDSAYATQAARMAKARAPFRRPAIEVVGAANYRAMERIGLLAWRGVRETDGDYSNEINYAEPATWSAGMRAAAASLDPTVVGYAKQMLADNQYLSKLTVDSRYFSSLTFDSQGAFSVFADYAAVKAAADSGARLPMTDGQPDFVWADEVSGVIALKRGSERLWIAPYWQAKSGTGINGLARFHRSTATFDQYGVLETTPQFSAGGWSTRPDYIDKPEGDTYVPPSPPSNAYAGERLPLGRMPADAQDGAPYRGVAEFHTFRFGPYLFGMNRSETARTLRTPVGFTSATDLVSGATLTGAINVPAAGSVVLLLGSNTDAAPAPATPLLLTATGASTPAITLAWTAASGATSYTVSRATVSGGPYSTLAAGTGLTTTSFTDTSVSAAAVYYYVVTASNAHRTSYASMEASASAGLPSPWNTADLGTVGLAGSASYENKVFTLAGTGTNIGGTADSGRAAWIPVTGDGEIIARVTSDLQANKEDDKVGLMVRESTATGARNYTLFLDGLYDNLLRGTYRTATNGSTASVTDGPLGRFPQWLRIVRSGDVFTGYCSSDGVVWTVVGAPVTIAMTSSSPVLFGLVVCARDSETHNLSTFDNVRVSPGWLPPAAPANIAAAGGVGAIALTWTTPAAGAAVTVKRATAPGGPYTVITSGLTGGGYTDTGLPNGTTYYYVLSTTSAAGEGPDSAEFAATTLVPPSTPAGLAATAGVAQVTLTWNAVLNATTYTVKRATVAGGPYAVISSAVATASFTDTGLLPVTTYYYVINAVNAVGSSADTSEVSATPTAGTSGTWASLAAAARPNVTTALGNANLTLSANPFAVGDLVQVSAAFSGFTSGRYYWVVASSGLTIQLSSTRGGTAITPTAAGTTNTALRSAQKWSTATNWLSSTPAAGPDATATFPIGAPAAEVAAVLVDTDTTLGRLLYSNTGNVADFTLATGPTSTLTFTVSGTLPELSMPMIEVPVASNRRLNLGERDNAVLRLGGSQGLLIRSSPGGAVTAGLGSQPAKEVTIFNADWSAFSGGLTVDRGILSVQAANDLPQQSLTVGTAFTSDAGTLAGVALGAAQAIDGLSGNSTGRLYGAQTLTLGIAGGAGSFQGILGQQFNGLRTTTHLVKSGAGRQDLGGTITGNGTVTINAGTLAYPTGAAHDASGAHTVATGGTLLVGGTLAPVAPIVSPTLAGTNGSVTFTSSTALRTGDQLRISTANAGLTLGTLYHVVNTPTASTSVQLSLTPGGAAVSATASATATAQFLNATTGTAGRLTVASGGTLGGGGTISPFDTAGGSTTALSIAGVLSPGDPLVAAGVGTLTLDGSRSARPLCSLESGAQLLLQLGAAGNDRLAVASAQPGDLSFANNVVNFVDLSGGTLPGGNYTLVSSDNAAAFTGLTTDGSGVITSGLVLGTGLEAYANKSLKLVGNTIVLTLVTLTPRELWRQTHFGTAANTGQAADSADPDGDGMDNLTEYAFGLSPTAPSALPVTTGTTVVSGATYLTLTFPRIADATLVYAVHSSSALVSGFTASGFTVTGGGPDTVTYTDTVAVSAGSPRFARVVVGP